MGTTIKTKRLRLGGMTCAACQHRIERSLQTAVGVQRASVSYSTGIAEVTYDTALISLQDIAAMIEALDYEVLTEAQNLQASFFRVAGILGIIVFLYVLLSHFGILNLLVPSQLADTNMGYGFLFLIGLITSVHCVAMCGGLNLSQSIPRGDEAGKTNHKWETFLPALLYNLGRVISYTVIGFVLGLAGLLFGGGEAGLPLMAQGILKLLAGAFMVVMGIDLLGIFPLFRRLQPRVPRIFAQKSSENRTKKHRPLVVGLLNGLMPCGPLQSMQIVALASGNPMVGALSMVSFSLGTVPLMLGLGSIVSALGKKFATQVMNVGAVLVVVLGLAMLAQGGSLSGFLPADLLLVAIGLLSGVGLVSSIPFKRSAHKTASTIAALGIAVALMFTWGWWGAGLRRDSRGTLDRVQRINGVQVVKSTLSVGSYPNITVQVGMPVQWILHAPKGSVNGCNNRLNLQEYDLFNVSIQTGDNVIEFLPERTGRFQYSCWMGMIRAYITVIEGP